MKSETPDAQSGVSLAERRIHGLPAAPLFDHRSGSGHRSDTYPIRPRGLVRDQKSKPAIVALEEGQQPMDVHH